jgi:hypothetical protein
MVAQAPDDGEFTDFRDALAMEAMTSIISSDSAIAGLRGAVKEGLSLSSLIAMMAYDLADEMIRVRDRE